MKQTVFLFTILCGLNTLQADSLTQVNIFPVSAVPSKMAYSPEYDLLFVMPSTGAIKVYDANSGIEVSQQNPKNKFTDMDISPDGRYLFAADYGGTVTGYGDPINQHYVHRFDLAARTWEVGNAPKIAYRIEAVSGEQVLLLEQDQWVDITLNSFGPIMVELARLSADYYGDMEFDAVTGRIYHGNSGSSSSEINVYTLSGTTLNNAESSGTYGTAQNGGGTAVLSSDASKFYYGALQVEALNVKNNLRTFPSRIYAATKNLAFGSSAYYNAATGAAAGILGFTTTVYAVSADGMKVLAYNPSAQKAVKYKVATGQSNPSLTGMIITGPSQVSDNETSLFNAAAVFSDGTHVNVTPSAQWSVSTAVYGSIAANGIFTAYDSDQEGTFEVIAKYTLNGKTVEANKEVTYSPRLAEQQLTKVESLTAGGGVSQMEFSEPYNLIFMRNGGATLRVMDLDTKQIIDVHNATNKFTDMDLTADGEYLFVADYGGTSTGYGTPLAPHYVHRYELATGKWTVLKAPKIAWKIEAVSANRVLLQEQDQWVSITLNTFDTSMQELSRIGIDYYGDCEYDALSRRVYHGNSGLSSQQIDVRQVVGDTLVNNGGTGMYGTAQGYGGTSTLSTDGKYFYYGKLQVNALNVTENLNVLPEAIYAASPAIAFGTAYYYDAYKGQPLGTLGLSTSIYALSENGKHLWAFNDANDTLHHYVIGAPQDAVKLTSVKITGPAQVYEDSNAPYQLFAYYSNGTSRDVTTLALWSVKDSNYAHIDSTAVLTTLLVETPAEPVTICASLVRRDGTFTDQLAVTINAACSNGQLAIRNINKAIILKKQAQEMLKAAEAKEKLAFKLVSTNKGKPQTEYLQSGKNIAVSMIFENIAKSKIAQSIVRLTNAGKILQGK